MLIFRNDTFSPTSQALNLAPVYTRRRVDQLKLLAAVREILHNDDTCSPFFRPYCNQIEKLLHAVAVKTSLHDVESCIILCDLVEEFLSSLILSTSHTKHRVLIQKDNAIDWDFWLRVIQRMLSGENSNTELRALAFLFNVWDHIPISSHSTTATSRRNSSDLDAPETIFDLYFDDQEGLRWNCTVWLLSPQMWKKYFCHWHPLVRAYYLRLLCWRIASVGSESGLLSDVIFNNYNADVRFLLEQRLQYTFSRFHEFSCITKLEGRPIPSVAPCNPVLNRSLKIVFNPASTQATTPTPESPPEPHTRRIDPYEVFDDIAYSCPPVALPSDLLATPEPPALTRKSRSASTSAMHSLGNGIKKRWSSIRQNSSGNLKKYFSKPEPEVEERPKSDYSFAAFAPSLTFSESTVSSSIETPSSLSPGSPPKNEQSVSPESLTMSLIPPPPQILRKRPEVTRPLYKFSLEYSEQAIRKHRKLLRGEKVADTTAVTCPRLPFGTTSCDVDSFGRKKLNTYTSGFANNSQLRLVLDLYQPDESNNDIKRYSTSSESYSDVDDVVNSEFEYQQLEGNERINAKSLDDSQYWKYGGRALNEWTSLVEEFEEFVQSRIRTQGVVRLEDVGVPFLIAEIPAKALVG